MAVLTASIRQFGVHFFERVLLLPSSRIYVVTGMSSSHASTFSTNFSCQFFSVAFKKCTQGSCVVTLPLSTPPNPLDSCYDRPSTDTRQFWQFFGDSTSSVLVREKLRHDNETSLLRPSVPIQYCTFALTSSYIRRSHMTFVSLLGVRQPKRMKPSTKTLVSKN